MPQIYGQNGPTFVDEWCRNKHIPDFQQATLGAIFMADAKLTPLAKTHEDLGGKMVDFAGWWMPVQYEGLRQEHNAVRSAAGLFDVSHMGEIRVKGPKALETVEWFTTNHVAKLENGQAQYTLFPNDQGGVVDDLIVYCMEKNEDYLLCVNASNKDKDLEFVLKNNKGADISDESDHWGQLALQGQKAPGILRKAFSEYTDDMAPFHFIPVDFKGVTCYLATTGYTGEAGAEIFVPADQTVELWNYLLETGKPDGLVPCGLGARDTLRTEMKYPLYGNEIDDTTNPYQAGLGWVVKPKLKDFHGMDLILKNKESITQKLVGFELMDRGIPRTGYPLLSPGGEEIGRVTSGTQSPSTGKNIGIGYINKDFAELDTEFLVGIRSRQLKAKVVKTPFVQPGGN